MGEYLTENIINFTNDKQIDYTFENESWNYTISVNTPLTIVAYSWKISTKQKGEWYFFIVKRPTSEG